MLRVFSEEFDFSIRNVTHSDCPLILDGEFEWIKQSVKKGCSQYRHSIFNEAKQYSTVVIGGSWDHYYAHNEFVEGFEQTIQKLSKNVKRVVILAKVPIFPGYKNKCEILSLNFSNLSCSTRYINQKKEDISNHYLRKLANKYDNVQYFDIRDMICNGDE